MNLKEGLTGPGESYQKKISLEKNIIIKTQVSGTGVPVIDPCVLALKMAETITELQRAVGSYKSMTTYVPMHNDFYGRLREVYNL